MDDPFLSCIEAPTVEGEGNGMSEVVICEPVRTPVGAFGGVRTGPSTAEAANLALVSLLARTGLRGGDIDDAALGHCDPNGESPAIGRLWRSTRASGPPCRGYRSTAGAARVFRPCCTPPYRSAVERPTSSSPVASSRIESMRAEHDALGLRQGVRSDGVQLMDRLARGRVTAGSTFHPLPGGMLETAENLRAEYDISHSEEDELALRSPEACAVAVREGRFDDEIVPIEVPGRRGSAPELISRDEHPRPEMTLGRLSALHPVRLGIDPEATVTAGSASGQNDGAALCVITTRDHADRHQLRPMLSIASWAVAGVGPHVMGTGPVPATVVALKRADFTLVEPNEAFAAQVAAQVIACLRESNRSTADRERLNVNGSGISLGHPVRATGARILATLAHEVHRRSNRLGLETMCIGGGQGLAAIFEAVR